MFPRTHFTRDPCSPLIYNLLIDTHAFAINLSCYHAANLDHYGCMHTYACFLDVSKDVASYVAIAIIILDKLFVYGLPT